MTESRYWKFLNSLIQLVVVFKPKQIAGSVKGFLRVAGGTQARITQTKDTPQRVTVIIPVLNEAAHIADVVAYAFRDPATDQVLVVDDGSTDNTVALARQAGAEVMTSSMLGKGASMQDGLLQARNEVVAYLDGDLTGLRPNIITDISRPIIDGRSDFVKARFGRGGGRVTELTAKPMVKIFFPELARYAQPLGGIIAARKSLLSQLTFEGGYGVDVGLLIDAHMMGARLTEVDIGHLKHDSQPLHDLTYMANEVSRVIFHRAKKAGRLHVEQIAAMFETQRQSTASVSFVLSRWKRQDKLMLLDMDGTIIRSRFAVELARVCGKGKELKDILRQNDIDAAMDRGYEAVAARCNRVAGLFRFVHKNTFEEVAKAVEIREGVVDFIKEMRRRGFIVGIISDSYFVAADIIRRRTFADFALAHTTTFEADVCTGEVQINPAFVSDESDPATVCKSYALKKILDENPFGKALEVWAMGDNINDLEMLRCADRGFVIDPKDPALLKDKMIQHVDSFTDILARTQINGFNATEVLSDVQLSLPQN